MIVQDPAAEHEIRVRWLGNAEVFVTCKCLDKIRSGWRGKTVRQRLPNRHLLRGTADWKSLGDFPVGTPSEKLLEAFNRHLEGTNHKESA